MRDVDRDGGDPGLDVLRRDGRSDRFVNLKLDDQVRVLADHLSRIADRDPGVVSIADQDQLDVRLLGGPNESGVHHPEPPVLHVLIGVADPVPPAPLIAGHHPVPVDVHLLDHAAVAKEMMVLLKNHTSRLIVRYLLLIFIFI